MGSQIDLSVIVDRGDEHGVIDVGIGVRPPVEFHYVSDEQLIQVIHTGYSAEANSHKAPFISEGPTVTPVPVGAATAVEVPRRSARLVTGRHSPSSVVQDLGNEVRAVRARTQESSESPHIRINGISTIPPIPRVCNGGLPIVDNVLQRSIDLTRGCTSKWAGPSIQRISNLGPRRTVALTAERFSCSADETLDELSMAWLLF